MLEDEKEVLANSSFEFTNGSRKCSSRRPKGGKKQNKKMASLFTRSRRHFLILILILIL
jgi:hypothetical protein